jgi:superfamily I DNA/RNA helicase
MPSEQNLPENDELVFDAEPENRSLLYVAATRARKSLLVCRISKGA